MLSHLWYSAGQQVNSGMSWKGTVPGLESQETGPASLGGVLNVDYHSSGFLNLV
jgi:hypothetical protein